MFTTNLSILQEVCNSFSKTPIGTSRSRLWSGTDRSYLVRRRGLDHPPRPVVTYTILSCKEMFTLETL